MKIINNHGLLLPQQVNFLLSSGSQSFCIGKYQSLDNILTTLNVDVFIEPGIIRRPIPAALDDAEEYWRMKTDWLESLIPDAEDKEAAINDYRNARNNCEEISKEKEQWSLMPLRGLYDPIGNVIKLYPEEMMQEYNGTRMDELLVSTLAHETMHAYFNRPRHKSFPYVIHVEEPFAEFGMLLYLHETSSNYYNWAYQDVSGKKTCYRYGAKLMDQYLNHDKCLRQDLEVYKIKLNDYPMPTVDSVGCTISMPINGSVQVNGSIIHTKWVDVFKYPPRYFYDKATKTFGLDGIWSNESMRHRMLREGIDFMIMIDGYPSNPLNYVYLGDNFTIDNSHYLDDILESHNVIVSPANKEFYAKNGIPFCKKSNNPFLSSCGDGLYKICRNGKWGVIDKQLNQVVPCNYDWVWSFDKNGLLEVKDAGHYGLVNIQGNEQVPVIYDNITKNTDGTYTVKHNNDAFKIDKYGQKI